MFNNSKVSFDSAYQQIASVVYLSGSRSKGCLSHSIREFSFLKSFGIDIHLPRPQLIKEVSQNPPCSGTIKCNTDGSSKGSPGHAASGGIFRDHMGGFLGCFSSYIFIHNDFLLKSLLLFQPWKGLQTVAGPTFCLSVTLPQSSRLLAILCWSLGAFAADGITICLFVNLQFFVSIIYI